MEEAKKKFKRELLFSTNENQNILHRNHNQIKNPVNQSCQLIPFPIFNKNMLSLSNLDDMIILPELESSIKKRRPKQSIKKKNITDTKILGDKELSIGSELVETRVKSKRNRREVKDYLDNLIDVYPTQARVLLHIKDKDIPNLKKKLALKIEAALKKRPGFSLHYCDLCRCFNLRNDSLISSSNDYEHRELEIRFKSQIVPFIDLVMTTPSVLGHAFPPGFNQAHSDGPLIDCLLGFSQIDNFCKKTVPQNHKIHKTASIYVLKSDYRDNKYLDELERIYSAVLSKEEVNEDPIVDKSVVVV